MYVVMPFRSSPYLDGTDNLFQHISSNRQFYPFLPQSASFSVILWCTGWLESRWVYSKEYSFDSCCNENERRRKYPFQNE